MSFDYLAAINEAANQGPDMREAVQGGGGDYEPPAAGGCRLRFVGYCELGIHEETTKDGVKKREKVWLSFELSGPKHTVEGEAQPHVISWVENLSLNEKANFFKLFKRMNYDGTAKHMAQLLGKEFLGTVVHKVVGEGADKRTYANLRDESGYTIRPPFVEDIESGETKRVTVIEARTPIKVFLWNFATKPMWDALFIDGRYPDKKNDAGEIIKEGASKNYHQNRIKAALNFAGSPVAALIGAGGEPDLPGAETPARKEAPANDTASDDPLAAMS
jgi:hypothetical protein